MKNSDSTTHSVASLPLVEIRNSRPVTTSLQIAKIFGKEHFNVLRDINTLDCSAKFIALNFEVYHYFSKLNENYTRKLPMYYITRDGFTFLAMGFTGRVAAKFKEEYINAFNKMERVLKEDAVPKKALREAQKQIAFWQNTANSALDSGLAMAEMIAELRQERQASTIQPCEFYKLTSEYYACAVRSFAEWLDWENTGCYDPNYRDRHLVERLEATRLLYRDPNRKVPIHITISTGRR